MKYFITLLLSLLSITEAFAAPNNVQDTLKGIRASIEICNMESFINLSLSTKARGYEDIDNLITTCKIAHNNYKANDFTNSDILQERASRLVILEKALVAAEALQPTVKGTRALYRVVVDEGMITLKFSLIDGIWKFVIPMEL